eukprot:TRINITY_DN6444_c0_g2_i4.p1 TRINITY_DN6444_c0_g2~~TRINITY_DN6444_c0_g2_i4.p1  ORF type:complete len:903 (+),score=135.68 TRINITY_DN6444_c0_g2_i4:266-2710(+)
MPQDTCWQRFERAQKMSQIYEEFVNTATKYGKIIIEELSIASSNKTISRCSTVGIAGGEKFCYDGIFFKLATDPFKLYGGVHFSIKAAGHELKAFNELVKVSNLISVTPSLHFPMITLIDYLGYRLVAVAALPISRKTLKYGSDDGCKTIHNQLPELQDLIQKVAKLLYLKPHIVGSGMNNEPIRLDFPADVEGHLGTDGKYYLVDVHRLFPAEREFLTSYAILIPENVNEAMKVITLDRLKWTEEISSYLNKSGTEWTQQSFSNCLLVVYSTYHEHKYDDSAIPEVARNVRAQDLTGSAIYGDAIVVLGEQAPAKREVLYYMFRPEWLQECKVKVSSDVFTKFGIDNCKEHEEEVAQITKKLVEEHIPAFAQWLVENSAKIVSSLHFPKLLQEHGINLRYTGLLFTLIPDTCKRLKFHTIGFQMLVRVITDLLQAQLRSRTFESYGMFEQDLVNFFNLVLGKGPESDRFWQSTVPVQLMLKYGPFGYKCDPDFSWQPILGHLMLFQLMQHHTGVWFKPDVESRFLPENDKHTANPLTVNDLLRVTAKVKRWSQEIFPFIKEVAQSKEWNPYIVKEEEDEESKERFATIRACLEKEGLPVEEIEGILDKIKRQRIQKSLCIDTYGESSHHTAASVFMLASMYADAKATEFALTELIQGATIFSSCGAAPGEMMLACLYLTAHVFTACGMMEGAKEVYMTLVKHIEQLWDSSEDANSASPFEVELHQQLLAIAESTNNIEEIEAHRRKLNQFREVFGDSTETLPDEVAPLIQKFLDFDGLSGVTLDYSTEWAELLSSLQQGLASSANESEAEEKD